MKALRFILLLGFVAVCFFRCGGKEKLTLKLELTEEQTELGVLPALQLSVTNNTEITSFSPGGFFFLEFFDASGNDLTGQFWQEYVFFGPCPPPTPKDYGNSTPPEIEFVIREAIRLDMEFTKKKFGKPIPKEHQDILKDFYTANNELHIPVILKGGETISKVIPFYPGMSKNYHKAVLSYSFQPKIITDVYPIEDNEYEVLITPQSEIYKYQIIPANLKQELILKLE